MGGQTGSIAISCASLSVSSATPFLACSNPRFACWSSVCEDADRRIEENALRPAQAVVRASKPGAGAR